ncbi:MAG: 16S rRNA (guanine(527)-N(7))-methyltransferase RsmG [Pseudomonadota bacterium]|nr:16S rRNA (guanine(527)-N(7))-methyltransferase RsmG [Pseudomonadota bacterium]
MKTAELLQQGLHALACELPEGASEALLDYLVLLEKWNRTINLTAIRERERMVTQHLLDSLSVLPSLGAADHRLVDIGTGAGLPGIPLAIARPELQVTLVEPNQKKVAFLRQAKAELNLSNVEVQGVRAEDVVAGQGFDVVISRAFADLPDFVKVGARLVAPKGRLIAMKGLVPYEEIARLPADASTTVHAVDVPQLAATRHLIEVRFATSGQPEEAA